MKNYLILLFVILGSISSAEEFTDLYGDYLGQTPPGDTPVVFAPGIITTSKLEHSPAVFSKDGNEVYWCWGRPHNISYMRRINNRWTRPERFAPFGDGIEHWDPFLSVDNKRFYFTANPNGRGDIWYVERQPNNEWGKPKSISPVINNSEPQWQAVLTSNGTVYYSSELGTTGSISRSEYVNGKYLKPKLLPPHINMVEHDGDPYIAPDDSYMLFASRRPNEFRNTGKIYHDIYLSFHDIENDKWSEPIHLGEPINTFASDRRMAISPDGKYMFFIRYNRQTGSDDVFWVSTKIIEKLKQKHRLAKKSTQVD